MSAEYKREIGWDSVKDNTLEDLRARCQRLDSVRLQQYADLHGIPLSKMSTFKQMADHMRRMETIRDTRPPGVMPQATAQPQAFRALPAVVAQPTSSPENSPIQDQGGRKFKPGAYTEWNKRNGHDPDRPETWPAIPDKKPLNRFCCHGEGCWWNEMRISDCPRCNTNGTYKADYVPRRRPRYQTGKARGGPQQGK